MESKVFIVTGAGRGIGLAVAKHLLKNSDNKVVAISRSPRELLFLKAEFSQVEILGVDMTEPEVRHLDSMATKAPSHLTASRLPKGQLNLPSRNLADWTASSSTMAPCPP